MRLKLTLLLGLTIAAAAGQAPARQQPPVRQPVPATPAQPVTPAPVVTAPTAPPPASEEPPPPAAAPPALPAPAPTVAEKPVTAAKPKSQTPEKPAQALRRARANTAIIQALDKVTAETLRFEAPIGQAIRYKSLVITVRACETSAADEEAPDSAAYMTIDSQPRPLAGRAPPTPKQVFRGWMFASSPGINPLQHPVYDVWLIACRASGPASTKR